MSTGKQIVKGCTNLDALGFLLVPRLIDEQNRLLCGDARVPDAGGTSRQRLRGRNVVIAAEKAGRPAAVREIDPLYSDAIVRRWHIFTAQEAVCASTGAAFTKREAAVNARNNDPAGGGALL
jgi:hypothetical protein